MHMINKKSSNRHTLYSSRIRHSDGTNWKLKGNSPIVQLTEFRKVV